jgi:hypothetical protein
MLDNHCDEGIAIKQLSDNLFYVCLAGKSHCQTMGGTMREPASPHGGFVGLGGMGRGLVKNLLKNGVTITLHDLDPSAVARAVDVIAVGSGEHQAGVDAGRERVPQRQQQLALLGQDAVRIGVLTGGGDCPGLNAVIRGIVRKGINHQGHEFVGFRYGWAGVLKNEAVELTNESTRGILHRGGTILEHTKAEEVVTKDGRVTVFRCFADDS